MKAVWALRHWGLFVFVCLAGLGRVAGAAPTSLLVVDDNDHNFGTVARDTAVTKVFRISSTGMAPATNVALAGLAAPFSQTNNCPPMLPKGGACAVTVAFRSAAPGTFNGALAITYAGGGPSPVRIALGATVAPPPPPASLAAKPAALNFGSVTVGQKSAAQTITLTNSGGHDATLAAAPQAPGYQITSTCAGGRVPTRGSCALSVVFAPTAVGQGNAQLSLAYQNGAGQQVALAAALAGTAAAPIAPASVAANPKSLAFGSVTVGTDSPAQVVTLSNSGGRAAVLAGEPAAPAGYKVTHNCPATGIPAGGSCQLNVILSPPNPGAKNGNLAVRYANGAGANGDVTVALTGTGAAVVPPANVAAAPNALAFGSVTVGTDSAAQAVTLTNSGGRAAVLAGQPTAPAGYKVTHNCPATGIPAGGSCKVSVVLNPPAPGARNGNLAIRYANGAGANGDVTVALTGTGAAVVPPANVAAAPNALAFGSVTVGTDSAAQVVSLTNSGGRVATLVAAPTAPAGYKVTHDCPATGIPAGGNCKISVVLNPPNPGPKNGNLAIRYGNGAGGNADLTVALTGTGAAVVPPANVAAAPNALAFGSVTVGTDSAAQVVTLTNSGGRVATLVGAPTAPAGYKVTHDCPATGIPAGGTCKVSVVLNPPAPGVRNGNLAIRYGNGKGGNVDLTVALTGTGAAAVPPANVAAAPNALAFGPVTVGTDSAAQVVTLTNSGGRVATLVGAPTAPPAYKVTHDCPATGIPAGGTCKISVILSPPGPGPKNGNLTLRYGNGMGANVDLTVALTGSGAAVVPPANLAAAPNALAFGTVTVHTDSAAQVVTLTNSGGRVARLNAPPAAPPGYKVTHDCPATGVPAGGTCKVSVVLNPPTPGAKNGELVLRYGNGAGTPIELKIALTGNGAAAVPPANVTGAPASLAFGAVTVGTDSPVQDVTLTNSGGRVATLVGPPAVPAGYKVTHDCPATGIPAGGTCKVHVVLSPPAPGPRNGNLTLRFANGAGGNQDLTIALTGSGAAVLPPANVAATPNRLNYGGVTVGTDSAPQTLTLTNNGGRAATLVGTPAVPGGYKVTHDCPATGLAAGASCKLTIVFNPPSPGPKNGNLAIRYANGAGGNVDLTIALTGNGTALVPPANLTAAPNALAFGSVTVGADSPKQLITLTNGGGRAAAIAGVPTAPPGYKVTHDCPGTGIPAGGTCKVSVVLNPPTPGPKNGNLVLRYANGAGANVDVTVALTGNGAAAVPPANVTANPTSLAFGAVSVGSDSAVQVITLTNGGGRAARLAGAPTAPPGYKVTHDCPETGIPVGGSCKLNVVFSPPNPGPKQGNLVLRYGNGAGANVDLTLALNGMGLPLVAVLTVAPDDHDFGSLALGAKKEQEFRITNSGRGKSGVPKLSALPAPFSVLANGCDKNPLEPSESCTFKVQFAPAAVGEATHTFSIKYGNGVQEQTLAAKLKGTGAGAASLVFRDLPPTGLAFGRVAVGETGERPLVVRNDGQVRALLGAMDVAAPFTVASVDCGAQLAPGATCRLKVSFAPVDTRPATGSLVLHFRDAPGAPDRTTAPVALQGAGIQLGALTVSGDNPTSFDNVPVGGQSARELTLTNAGAGVTRLVAFNTAAPFAVAPSPACQRPIAAGGTCTVRVTFTPAAAGAVRGTLAFLYQDGAGGPPKEVKRDLAGSGIALAHLSFAGGADVDFGSYPARPASPKVLTFTVTNTGTGAAVLGKVTLPERSPFSIVNNGCAEGSRLNPPQGATPGQSCPIAVGFAPRVAGVVEARLDVNYDAGGQARTLQGRVFGTGFDAASLTFDDVTELRFGKVPVGGVSDPINVTVSNRGGGPATLTSVELPEHFRLVANGCGTSLAASASCVVRVSFAPPREGPVGPNARLTIRYTTPQPAEPISLPLRGQGVEPARLRISDGPAFDFGTLAVGGDAHHLFTVTNTGKLSARIERIDTNAPFTHGHGNRPGACRTGGDLGAGESCGISVRYLPAVPGTTSGALTIVYRDELGLRDQARSLQGAAIVPAILVASDFPSFEFPAVALNGQRQHVVTLRNDGQRDAELEVPTSTSSNFSVTTDFERGEGCRARLARGATCRIGIRFTPTFLGRAEGKVRIRHQSGFGWQAIEWNLTGTGVNAGVLAFLDGGNFAFPATPVGSSQQRAFLLRNLGEAPVRLFGAREPGTGPGEREPVLVSEPFSWVQSGSNCRGFLRPQETCTLTLAFVPTNAGGAAGTATVDYHDGSARRSATINLTGLGLALATLVLSDSPGYDFGGVTAGLSSEARVFTVTNRGDEAATVGTSAISPPFRILRDDCSNTTLVKDARCAIRVTFSPREVLPYSDTLIVPYRSGASDLRSFRSVGGRGLAPGLLEFANAVDFGTVAVGSASTTRTVTLTNNGESPARVLSIPSVASVVVSDDTCVGTFFEGARTLAPGASCTFAVTYRPTEAGLLAKTLSVRFHDGLREASAALPLTGVAVAPASLAVTGATSNFGTVAIGAAPTLSFTVSNTGSGEATLQGFTFEPVTAPFSLATNGCPATLAPNASCTVAVAFSPSAAEASTAELRVLFSDGILNRSAARAVSGTGAQPASLAVSDNTLTYGRVPLGGSGTKVLTLTNSGGLPARLEVVNVAAPYFYSSTTCSNNVIPATNGRCELTFTFQPTVEGATDSSITLQYHDGAQSLPASVALSGTGIVAAFLAADATTVDFETVLTGATKQKSITVRNSGRTQASEIVVDDPAAPYTVTSLCEATLEKDATCSITVTFAPQNAAAENARLRIRYNDGAANRETTLSLRGSGVSPASLAVTDAGGYSFGLIPAGTMPTRELTVTNNGGFAASSVSVTVEGAAFSLSANGCGTTLERGATCTFTVRASAAAPGDIAGSVAIAYYDGKDNQTLPALALTGTGATPASLALTADDGSDFGRVAVAAPSSPKTFTLKNSGQTAATELAIVAAAPFSTTANDCGTSLAADGSCRITAVFTPQVAGDGSGGVTVGYRDGIDRQTAMLALTGTGVPIARITISEASPYDYGDVVVGGSKAVAFTVTNSGQARATTVAVASAAPFAITEGENGCGETLDIGASCQVTVTFAPAAAGAATGELGVSFNNALGDTRSTRALAGKGLAPAKLAFAEAPAADLGLVPAGDVKTTTFTVSNDGEWPASNVQAAFANAAPFTVSENLCTGTLAAGASCRITVSLTPPRDGDYADTLTVSYNDGVADRKTPRDLTGKGATPADVSVAEAPTYDFGRVATGTSASHAFVVRNAGETAAAAVSATALAGGYSISRNDCGSAVGAKSECTITVTFSPTEAGEPKENLQLSYNSGRETKTTSCEATATAVAAPLITISQGPAYDYQSVLVGKNRSQTFVVRNEGLAAAAQLALGALAAPFSVEENGCADSANLEKGAECTVKVTFTPTEPLPSAAPLAVTYHDSINPRSTSRQIFGLGRNPAKLALSEVAFGKVPAGKSGERAITVSNSGHVAATDLAARIEAPFEVVGNCGGSVESNSSCALTVKLTPKEAGEVSADLTVTYHDGIEERSVKRSLSGEGATPAAVALTADAAFDFGEVTAGKTASLDFTFENRGGTEATALAVALGSANAISVTRNGCAAPGLAAGASCTVRVTFAPAAAGGVTNELRLAYHSGREAKTREFPLTGSAVAAPLNGFDGAVNALAYAGKPSRALYAVGNFTTHNQTAVGRIARLKPDGTVDTDFASGTGFDAAAYAVAWATTTEVYVGGEFTKYGETAVRGLVRLKNDGSINADFDTGEGFDGAVRAIYVPADRSGKLYVAGDFTKYKGGDVKRVVRLNGDGSLDETFRAPALNGRINSMAAMVDAESRVTALYLGGAFTTATEGEDERAMRRLVKLGVDGAVDAEFEPAAIEGEVFVVQMGVDGSGRVFVGGASGLQYLRPGGASVADFRANTGIRGTVRALRQDWDGERKITAIYVGGSYTVGTEEDAALRNLGRLTPKGEWDEAFAGGRQVDGAVHSLMWSQAEDDSYHLSVGGAFTAWNEGVRGRFLRVGLDGKVRD